MANKKPEKSELLKALKGEVFKTNIMEKLGFSRKSNGPTRAKVSGWYEEVGIDLKKALLENTFTTKTCAGCGEEFKIKRCVMGGQQTTCSHGCSNTHFRTGEDHGNFKTIETLIKEDKNYRSICFHFHKKECVVCDENVIVEVHHYDLDHDNNDPENLIPLCPTHHQYVHSNFKHLVHNKIKEYVEKKKINLARETR